MPSWKKIIVEGSAPLVSSSAVVAGETLTDGYVTGITPSTQINDIIADMNTALGRLAPSRPAGLTGRGLRVTNTTYQSGIAHSSDWAVALRGTTPALQVLAGSTVNLTSSQASTAVSGSTVQFSASTALGSDPTGVAVVTFGAGVSPVGGTNGVLTVSNGSSSDGGFWYVFSASMASVTAPRDATTFSSASFILRETGGNTAASQSIFTDSVTAPVVTLTTNASAVAAPTTYISGIPTLVTGSTACNYTASIAGAVGKFYRTNILTVAETGVGAVFTSQTKTPTTTPASGSTVEIKDQLVVATGKFADPIDGTAATITTTAVNIASTTGTGTTTFSDVYIDSVSVEGKRLYSSASTAFPDTNLNYLSNTFDSSIPLTNSRNIYGSAIVEMQLRNGVYIKPTANYSTLYFPNISSIGNYNYSTLNYNSGSFSQYYDITPGVGKQTLLMTINGTNFGTTDDTTKLTTGISILVKFQYGANSYTAWGDANKANGSGGADGVGLMVADGDTRGTSTQLVKKLNLPSLNAGGFNASSATITRAYVRIINFQPTMATVNQVITFV